MGAQESSMLPSARGFPLSSLPLWEISSSMPTWWPKQDWELELVLRCPRPLKKTLFKPLQVPQHVLRLLKPLEKKPDPNLWVPKSWWNSWRKRLSWSSSGDGRSSKNTQARGPEECCASTEKHAAR
mmetsp:Transcript_92956/g.129037  ORF Transcript_92956/g.129037 Transcript_92956/m.129037 type:complete len:126 (+) Transcript_92956:141-518(+)